jgi:hypothetical protein
MLGLHLKRFSESHGIEKTKEFVSQAIQEGKISQSQISLRNLAEGMIGSNWAAVLKSRAAGGVMLREAEDAVSASAFYAITGQLLIDKVKEKYNAAQFVGDKLCVVESISNGNLGPQREPYLSDVIDDSYQVQEGQNFPHTSFTQQYIDYPVPKKFGLACNVTFEMIFSDLTNQAYNSAGSVGERVRINREERQLRIVYGIDSAPYSWNGTTYNIYQSSAPWVNTVSGKVVQDWTDLNDLEQVFVNMLDPVTKKPINILPNAALVMPYKYYHWKRINEATNTKTGAYSTSGLTPQTEAPNPIKNSPFGSDYEIIHSKFGYAQVLANGIGPNLTTSYTAAQAREVVVFGDFKKAFVYREVHPLEVSELPPNNILQHNQDIIFSVRAKEFGVMCVRDPRYVMMAYNS